MSQDDEAQLDSLKRSPPPPPPPPPPSTPPPTTPPPPPPADRSLDRSSALPIDQFVHSLHHHMPEDVLVLRSNAANSSPLRVLFSIFLNCKNRLDQIDHQQQQQQDEQHYHDQFNEAGRSRPVLPRWLIKRLTFYRLHLAYFVIIACLASICIRLFPKPSGGDKMAFIDCIYNAVSSVCTTGLISVRMSSFSTPDNVLIMLLMTLGSPIFTSVLPLYIRLFQFRKNIAEMEHYLEEVDNPEEPEVKPEVRSDIPPAVSEIPPAASEVQHPVLRKRSNKSLPTLSNVDIDTKLRDALVAVKLEHDALVTLNWIVSVYLLVWTALGFTVIEIIVQCSAGARAVLKERSVNHLFFSLFATISAFTNSGIMPLDDSVAVFRENNGMLLWLSLLILVGNTLFAPCLRAVIWCLKTLTTSPEKRSIYEYLLTNPRRCFTHLFPRNQTVWLVVTVMAFNAVESGFYYVLSWRTQALEGLTVPEKLVNGVFQSITTRSAGLTVTSIAGLSPSMLVLYIAMMYIAVYPVYLSRQNSQAQDVSVQDLIEKKKKKKKARKVKKIRSEFSIAAQSKRLIATDTAYLFISVFVLCLIENKRINDDPLNFSVFNIIFEVISAYGNVGLSIGYSCSLLRKLTSFSSNAGCNDVPYSFSGTWSVPGKLLMIVIMFLGRHRGLPDNMDSALQIPKSFFTSTKRDDPQSSGDAAAAAASIVNLDHQLVEIRPDCRVEIPTAMDFSADSQACNCSGKPVDYDHLELQVFDRYPVATT